MGYPTTIVHRDRPNAPFTNTTGGFGPDYYTPTGETVSWEGTLENYLLAAGYPDAESVRAAQSALGIPETGKWDSDTAAGIVNIQMTYGLPATGFPDSATLAKIAGVLKTTPKDRKKDNSSDVIVLAVAALAIKFLFFRE